MEAKLSPDELESFYLQLLEDGATLTLATILEAMLIVWAIEADLS